MLDHVALLVPALEPALEALAPLGLAAGPLETFPSEGTREVYLGEAERPGRLLLMQPLGEAGPYARALAKRGPGLHHLALRRPDLEAALDALPGWLLHPASLRARASGTVWLARPGVGTLVELMEHAEPSGGEPVVAAVEVPAPAEQAALLAALGRQVARAGGGAARLRVGDEWVDASLRT